MGRIVRKLNPFFSVQFEQLENWLEDMARKGLVLKKAGSIIMTFEKGEPCEKKYRTIPESANVSDEEIGFYEQAGWHYMGRNRIHILCNDDKDAPELFTDKESYNARASNLLYDLKLDIIGGILLALFWSYEFTFGSWDGGLLHWLSDSVFIDAIILLGILYSESVLIYLSVLTFKLIRKIKSGAILERKKDNGKKVYILKGITVLIVSFMIGVSTGYLIKSHIYESEEVSTYSKDLKNYEKQIQDPKERHPLSVKIYNKAFYTNLKKQITEEYKRTKEIKKLEDEPDYDPPRFERTKEKKNLFKKCNYEYACAKGENGTYYGSEYYEANSEWIARKYLEEEIEYWIEGKTAEQIKFDLPGADYAGFGKNEFDRYLLYVRKGNKFEIVDSNNDPGIKDKAELFLKDLTD